MANACGLSCELCPAAARCGSSSNFCLVGRCKGCESNQLSGMEVRASVIRLLGGLDLEWPRPVRHHQPRFLPDHLPVLVQAYADPIDVPWVAFHAGRVLGVTGRGLTAKHRRPLHEVYWLAPRTRLALEFYVEDRVLEGLWANRHRVIGELKQLGLELVLSPNFSVWRDHSRFEQLVQQRRSFAFYHELIEAGLPAIPDVGWSRFEPDGRLWAEWINSQSDLRAVSIFCGGRKIHAVRRAQRETEEDISLFHRAVRSQVTFVLGGVHAPGRLAALRNAAPGRRLVICNGMAYALAQRRRLLDRSQSRSTARSTRECFLHNCAFSDHVYAHYLGTEMADAV